MASDNQAKTAAITFETSRFGRIEVPADRVLTLPLGMVGFPEYRRYVLVQHRPDSPFYWLQSLESPALAFAVVNPLVFDRSYELRLSTVEARLLRTDDPAQLQIWVVVTIPHGHPEAITANLKAPLVINLQNRLAAQVILDDPRYSLRQALSH